MIRLLLIGLSAIGLMQAAEAVSDGARVHYESYGKGKEAVVFIHGWTCDLTFWRGQAPVYQGRRSLLVDLPGHGLSEKPDVAYTPERFARGVDAVMRDAGVERAVLVGHSMGGPVAFTFLRLYPAKTKALVLVDAFIPAAPKDEAERAKRKAQIDPLLHGLREPAYKDRAQAMIKTMLSDRLTPAQREEIRSKMLATPQHVMASAMEQMFAMDGPKPGETYSLPVMAIMVARPGRSSKEQLSAIFPNLTYEEWEGSEHFLMMESPDRFNRALETFLASRPELIPARPAP